MNRKQILIAQLKAVLWAEKQIKIYKKRYEPPQPKQVNNGKEQKTPTNYPN